MSWASRHNLLARSVNRNLGGVPVIWGAVSAEAILEQNAQFVSDGNVISVEYMLHNLPTELFQGVKYNDAMTVGGDAFLVREPMVIGDGAFMMVSLEKVDENQLPDYVLDGELGFDDSTTVVVYEGGF
jgi:hypothetical protein